MVPLRFKIFDLTFIAEQYELDVGFVKHSTNDKLAKENYLVLPLKPDLVDTHRVIQLLTELLVDAFFLERIDTVVVDDSHHNE